MTDTFTGQWVLRNGIRRPVVDAPTVVLCSVCGNPAPSGLCRPCRDSTRDRVHGSHAGYAQHKRRFELPCRACSDAEKQYQGKRYRKGSLSVIDRAWCERAAVAQSWRQFERINRLAAYAERQNEG